MERFEQCLQFVLRPDIEGGYSNQPADKGGPTNHGVTQHTYDVWRRKQGRVSRDVRDIEPNETAAIYREEFWQPVHCADMPAPVDMVAFDAAVQHGPARSVQLLQQTLRVPVTRTFDAATRGALTVGAAEDVALDMMTERTHFYSQIIANNPSQSIFANGWANRIDKLRVECGL